METYLRLMDAFLVAASLGLFVFFLYDWYKEDKKN